MDDLVQFDTLLIKMQSALRKNEPCVLVIKKNVSSLGVVTLGADTVIRADGGAGGLGGVIGTASAKGTGQGGASGPTTT